jgi:hypothetical protein
VRAIQFSQENILFLAKLKMTGFQVVCPEMYERSYGPFRTDDLGDGVFIQTVLERNNLSRFREIGGYQAGNNVLSEVAFDRQNDIVERSCQVICVNRFEWIEMISSNPGNS